MKLFQLFVPALAALAMSIPASASLITANGDFQIGFVGNLSYVPGGGALLGATSITLPTNTGPQGERISNLDISYLGLNNSFCNTGDCGYNGPTPLFIGQTVSLSSNTLDLTGVVLPTLTFSSTSPADNFTFVANLIAVSRTHVGNADFVNVFYSGLLNDSAAIYFPNAAASLSFSFTQTGGPTGGVAGSATFATPPQANPGTPEPATMTLFGSALVGLGLMGRKRLTRR